MVRGYAPWKPKTTLFFVLIHNTALLNCTTTMKYSINEILNVHIFSRYQRRRWFTCTLNYVVNIQYNYLQCMIQVFIQIIADNNGIICEIIGYQVFWPVSSLELKYIVTWEKIAWSVYRSTKCITFYQMTSCQIEDHSLDYISLCRISYATMLHAMWNCGVVWNFIKLKI